jgi:hypothetical protein
MRRHLQARMLCVVAQIDDGIAQSGEIAGQLSG